MALMITMIMQEAQKKWRPFLPALSLPIIPEEVPLDTRTAIDGVLAK